MLHSHLKVFLTTCFVVWLSFSGGLRSAEPDRLFMRVNGVDLTAIQATGFDVHLTVDSKLRPKRTDSSFVGSIALFRHEGHTHHGAPTEGLTASKLSDTFNVTKAVVAAGEVDVSRLHVVIVPYSLSSTVDGKNPIVETGDLRFDNIDFFSN